MAVLTVTPVSLVGSDLDALLVAAAAAGDLIPNSGSVFVVVKNTNVTTRVVTVKDRGSRRPANSMDWDPDVVVNVPQGDYIVISLADTERFNDGNGQTKLEYSSEVDLTVAAFTTRV